MTSHPPLATSRYVTFWLLLCLALIACMVLVGGYTRLSGSGLSITQWKPIHGVVPPLNEMQWGEEFLAYQASPQYEQINKGMTLAEFKVIFWPEFFHRLLGRAIGFVFILPLLFFAATKQLDRRLTLRLAAIFALGGLQGLMGWIMVKSGLQDGPYVSHFKLAMHLGLAFLLFGLILWVFLEKVASDKWQVIRKTELTTYHWPLTTCSLWFTLLCLQILLGALVAGLHGGLIYNTWPTMNGAWMAQDIVSNSTSWWQNIALIQFVHRWVAALAAGGFVIWWYFYRNSVKQSYVGKVCAAVGVTLAFQFVLGVLTLVHAVPLPLALAHQMTALLLFALAVVLLHALSTHYRG